MRTAFSLKIKKLFCEKMILRDSRKITKMADARFINGNKWVLGCRNAHFRTFATFPHFCVTKRPKCVLAYVYAVFGWSAGSKSAKSALFAKKCTFGPFGLPRDVKNDYVYRYFDGT